MSPIVKYVTEKNIFLWEDNGEDLRWIVQYKKSTDKIVTIMFINRALKTESLK